MHRWSSKEVQRIYRLERKTEKHRNVMVIPGFLWAWSFTWHPSTCLVNGRQSQNCLILKVQTKPGETWVKRTKQEHPGVLKTLSVSTLKPDRAGNKNSITSSWSSHGLHGLDLGSHVKSSEVISLFLDSSQLIHVWQKQTLFREMCLQSESQKNYHRWNTIKHELLTESQKVQWNKPLSVWNQTHRHKHPDTCK